MARRDGEASAWDADQLIRATAPRLFRLAARLVGSLAEAEDVLQESFLRAFTRLEAGALERPTAPEAWLRGVVVHAALDALRARGRRDAREGHAAVADVAADLGASLEARAALRELDRWLADLPPDQRTALVLKELEGHTSVEIAALLGCSEGAVEQRLVRARATLRGRRADDRED